MEKKRCCIIGVCSIGFSIQLFSGMLAQVRLRLLKPIRS
jgi:hypothetical protein